MSPTNSRMFLPSQLPPGPEETNSHSRALCPQVPSREQQQNRGCTHQAGDTQTLSLLPEQAYGLRDPSLIQQMPLSEFDGTFEPVKDQIVAFSLPDGDEVPGRILGVEEGLVEVDFNHPLARHEIGFRVEILEVGAAPAEHEPE